LTFLVPAALWLLLALPLLAWAYVAELARRGAVSRVSHPRSDLLAIAQAAAPRSHLPAILFGMSCLAWMLALTRPVATVPTPASWPVVLAIDVIRSMDETDIAPMRFEAAKSAAQAFVRGLPRRTRAAVVSFGSTTNVVVPLTDDRERVRAGIENLRLELRTQLGSGLREAVRLIESEASAAGSPAAPPNRDPDVHAGRKRVRVYTVGMGTGGDPSKFRSGYWGVLDETVLRQIAAETGGRY